MGNLILLNLLESVLGESKKTSNGNYSFFCPNGCRKPKKKLEINLNTNDKFENPYHCWVCGLKGKKLNNLFKYIKVQKNKLSQLNLIIQPHNNTTNISNSELLLPNEFIPLQNLNSLNKFDLIIAKKALNFLYNRNITELQIIKYNIGFCSEGKYNNRIIIPSYDEYGVLNYFSARTFIESNYNYIHPPVKKDNIIGFEYFINWKAPIILVEGAFDAITIQRNCIPLYGKIISPALLKKIINSGTDKIYICLDNDAKKESLSHCETFIKYGKKVYLVDLPGKDFSELGFEKSLEILENTYPLTFEKIIDLKLK